MTNISSMMELTNPLHNLSNKTKVFLVINAILGALLWFGLCTDYSWDNAWGNICFPPIVGCLGLIGLVFISAGNLQQKVIHLFLCIPSILGGIPYIFMVVLAFIPPFLLGTLFWLDEQSSATLIQRAESPTGSQIAEVYFLPVGAYSGGNGRIEVHLKYKWLPFVKRDVVYLGVTQADESTATYLSWIDDKTLYIPEKNAKVKINWIEWEVPSIILLPIRVARLFLRPP